MALDKTGTITSGEPRVTDILPAEGVSESELLTLAASLEQKSEHPLAKAVLAYAETETIACPDVTDFAALPGNGLSARLDGMEIYGGNAEFIAAKASVPAELQAEAARLAAEGKTPLFFGGAGRLMGVIAVADTLKEDSPRAIRELQNMGIRVVMLTGDNQRTADAIGRQAGVDEVIAGVLPDGKEAVIRRLQESGKVAMVGDGINDAPALTRHPAQHPRKPVLGIHLQHHRHPAGRRCVHPLRPDPEPHVRGCGHEPFQLLCCEQCPAAEPVRPAQHQTRPQTQVCRPARCPRAACSG